MVCWRASAVRSAPASTRKRSSSCSARVFTDKRLIRAAASSIARGMPSRRRQISPTTGSFSAVGVNEWSTARARSIKSATASSIRSDGKRKMRSPLTLSGSRLVARTRSRGQPAKSTAAAAAAPSMTCSQLSSTSARFLLRRCAISTCSNERPVSSCTFKAEAIAAITAPELSRDANPTKRAPKMPLPRKSPATRSAVCVLPTPPLPTSVTNRFSRSSALISAISS